MTVADRALTLEEFLRMPEREPPLEYEDGEVTRKVSPKLRHSAIQQELMFRIRTLAGSGQPVLAFPELRVTFGGRSIVPDLAGFRRERVPVHPDGRLQDDVFVPPDLVVEIVSPRQSVTRLVRRCLWYVENGVRVAVLVDPGDESAIAFRPGVQPSALRGEDRIDLTDVVPGFSVPAGTLFEALRLR